MQSDPMQGAVGVSVIAAGQSVTSSLAGGGGGYRRDATERSEGWFAAGSGTGDWGGSDLRQIPLFVVQQIGPPVSRLTPG